MEIDLGNLAEWIVIAGGLVGVYVNLRIKIEAYSNSCIRKEELEHAMQHFEMRFNDKFDALKELIEEKLKRIPGSD